MAQCCCGKPATTRVQVVWASHATEFWYCEDCADKVIAHCDDAEKLP